MHPPYFHYSIYVIMESMKIVLEHYDKKYTVESQANDYNAKEMKEYFNRLLVMAGYPPSVLEEEGGHWEWIEDK